MTGIGRKITFYVAFAAFWFLAAGVLGAPTAHAACSSPTAPNGALQIISGVWKQCNASNQWIDVGGGTTGVVCQGMRVSWTESSRTCNANIYSGSLGKVQTAVDPNDAPECSSVYCGTAVYTCQSNGTWSVSSPDCNNCSGGGSCCSGCGDDNDEALDDLLWGGANGKADMRALIEAQRAAGEIN